MLITYAEKGLERDRSRRHARNYILANVTNFEVKGL
jgi:hypothetical protein